MLTMTPIEVTALSVRVLARLPSGGLQWPRLSRTERTAINRYAWRMHRATACLSAYVLMLRLLESRRSDPDLCVLEFLRGLPHDEPTR